MTSDAHGPVISVMLAVPDAAAAARWYARGLGATELWDLGGVVGLTVEGAPFFLGEPANNSWDTPTGAVASAVSVPGAADSRHENLPPPTRSHRTVGVRRLLLPT
jgi:catechol 2,3-dioxygenase-like lactoylglutathione lyase family enzyme